MANRECLWSYREGETMDLKRLADWLPLRGRWLVYGAIYALLLLLTCAGIRVLLRISLDQMTPFGYQPDDIDTEMGRWIKPTRTKAFLQFAPFFMAVGTGSLLFGLIGAFGRS
jgi:hypothetical protein